MDPIQIAFLVGAAFGLLSGGFIVFMMMFRGGEADGF